MSADVSWWRVILGTGLCLALAVGAAVALKARAHGMAWKAVLPGLLSGSAQRRRRVEPLETFRITPQTQVCLLRWDAREYLIAITGSHVAVLDSREAPADEAAP